MPMGNGARRTPSRPAGARAQLTPADDGGPSGVPLPPLAFVPPGALSCKTDVDEIERGLRPQAAKLSESELTVRVAVGRLELGITACDVPHATYLLVVASGGELWCVRRRFRDFLLLEAAIATGGTPRPEALTRLAALPALKRTLLGPLSALSAAFRRRRAAALEAYLHAAAASALLRLAPLAAFLGLDIYHPSRRPSLLREPRSWTDPAASKSGSPLGNSCSSSSYSSLSSPDARAVPRALSGPRTIRVLCLHGRGSNPQARRNRGPRSIDERNDPSRPRPPVQRPHLPRRCSRASSTPSAPRYQTSACTPSSPRLCEPNARHNPTRMAPPLRSSNGGSARRTNRRPPSRRWRTALPRRSNSCSRASRRRLARLLNASSCTGRSTRSSAFRRQTLEI